jgi:hypothetical protein
MRINDTKGAAMQFARQAIGAATFLAVLGVPSSRMTTRAQAPPPVFANFEEAQTNPLRLSADGTLLFAVNTPNVNRRTDNEAWLVNQVSNSVSVVSPVAEECLLAALRLPRAEAAS